jgi:hypothetical protein
LSSVAAHSQWLKAAEREAQAEGLAVVGLGAHRVVLAAAELAARRRVPVAGPAPGQRAAPDLP